MPTGPCWLLACRALVCAAGLVAGRRWAKLRVTLGTGGFECGLCTFNAIYFERIYFSAIYFHRQGPAGGLLAELLRPSPAQHKWPEEADPSIRAYRFLCAGCGLRSPRPLKHRVFSSRFDPSKSRGFSRDVLQLGHRRSQSCSRDSPRGLSQIGKSDTWPPYLDVCLRRNQWFRNRLNEIL